MEFSKVIESRYSVRNFSNKKVEKEKITKILEAARLAPSAKNLQPTRVIVVQDKIEQMKEMTRCVFGSNVIFIICAQKTGIVSRKWGEVDATIAATCMMLQAHDLGLGTTIIGIFDKDKIKSHFCLNEELDVIMLLICGYPSIDAKPIQMHYEKKSLSEMMFKEDIDMPYKS